MDEIKNKIADSGLITLSLEDHYQPGERAEIDLAPWLYEGMILREKDFRAAVKEHHWEQYRNTYVSVYCSADAIIPQWAYMLIGSKLTDIAREVVYGSPEMLEILLMQKEFDALDFSQWKDERIILKGCGDLPIPAQAFLDFTRRLQPYAKSIMYGEACSTVPIYKKKKPRA